MIWCKSSLPLSLCLAAAIGPAVAQTAPAKPVKHEKTATYMSWGSPGNSLNGTELDSGFNNVDTPISITCANTAGCTFEIDAMVGIGYSSGNTLWAICAVVDGNFVTTPPCWSQSTVPSGGVVTGNSSQSIEVSAGRHTVQTQVSVISTAYLQDWHIDYVVFVP